MANTDPDDAGAKLMMDARSLRTLLQEDVVLDQPDELIQYVRITMMTMGDVLAELAKAYQPVDAGIAAQLDAAAEASRRSYREIPRTIRRRTR